MTPILAVGIPVGKDTKKSRQNMLKRSAAQGEREGSNLHTNKIANICIL